MARREVIGDCELWCGDCRSLLSKIPAEACIISDPPYGIAFRHSGGGRAVSNQRFLPNGGRAFSRHAEEIPGDGEPFDPGHLLGWPCALFGGDRFYERLPAGGSFHAWDKTRGGFGPDDHFSDVEFIWTSWKAPSEIVRHLWKGVCQDSHKGEKRHHPAQKPVAVMEAVIQMTAATTICDPYAGSGSTALACVALRRSFIGIEIDERHYETALRRIESAYRQRDLFIAPPAEKPVQLEMERG